MSFNPRSVNGSRHPGRSEPVSATGEFVADLYISADVETDGPIPGVFSMLSFGFVVVGTFDGRAFELIDSPPTFYRELRPIAEQYEEEALAVNGLDRDQLMTDGAEPAQAMVEAREWVLRVAVGYRPVLVAYPAVFDWAWLFWYFTRFVEAGSPFGFSGCLDIKTMLAVKGRTPLSRASRDHLPVALQPDASHTHNALDDAIEQAELFVRLFQWNSSPKVQTELGE